MNTCDAGDCLPDMKRPVRNWNRWVPFRSMGMEF